MKKKAILLGLIVTCLCFAGGCGLSNNGMNDETYPSSDMVDNVTSPTNDSVLDKGGANGTDNASLLDYLQETENDDYVIDDHSLPSDNGDLREDADDLVDDLGDAVHEAGEGIRDGVDALTSPNPSQGTIINGETNTGATNSTGTNYGGTTTGGTTSTDSTGSTAIGGNGR